MTPRAWKAQAGAFAQQLTLPQQQELLHYWLERLEGDDWPSFASIHPAAIGRLLPHLLILEHRAAPEFVHVRLAGSALWDIYGGEITGATLRQQDAWRGHAGYWRHIYERMQAHPMPDCGHLRDDARMAVLFWLRLPLRAADGGIWLLGLDMALPMSVVEDSWQVAEADGAEEPPVRGEEEALSGPPPLPHAARPGGLRITGLAASAATRGAGERPPRINISVS